MQGSWNDKALVHLTRSSSRFSESAVNKLYLAALLHILPEPSFYPSQWLILPALLDWHSFGYHCDFQLLSIIQKLSYANQKGAMPRQEMCLRGLFLVLYPWIRMAIHDDPWKRRKSCCQRVFSLSRAPTFIWIIYNALFLTGWAKELYFKDSHLKENAFLPSSQVPLTTGFLLIRKKKKKNTVCLCVGPSVKRQEHIQHVPYLGVHSNDCFLCSSVWSCLFAFQLYFRN